MNCLLEFVRRREVMGSLLSTGAVSGSRSRTFDPRTIARAAQQSKCLLTMFTARFQPDPAGFGSSTPQALTRIGLVSVPAGPRVYCAITVALPAVRPVGGGAHHDLARLPWEGPHDRESLATERRSIGRREHVAVSRVPVVRRHDLSRSADREMNRLVRTWDQHSLLISLP